MCLVGLREQDREKEKERALIKQQYLGADKVHCRGMYELANKHVFHIMPEASMPLCLSVAYAFFA